MPHLIGTSSGKFKGVGRGFQRDKAAFAKQRPPTLAKTSWYSEEIFVLWSQGPVWNIQRQKLVDICRGFSIQSFIGEQQYLVFDSLINRQSELEWYHRIYSARIASGRHCSGRAEAGIYCSLCTIKKTVAMTQASCYITVYHFLNSWGINVFSNFPNGIQVIIDAFANLRYMVIETTCRVK